MIIGHYMKGIWSPGGVASYIRRVSGVQASQGHQLFFFDNKAFSESNGAHEKPVVHVADDDELFRVAREYKLDILHLHTAISRSAKPTVPIIRTVHGHQPYCPSGTRFLQREASPCNRNYSAIGCLKGHLLSRCGSIRPASMLAGFEGTRDEMSSLKGVTIVTVSHFIRNQLVRAGYDGDLVHVLYLPAPDTRDYFAPPKDDVPHFLFLGRLTPLKGVDWLLRAVKTLDCKVHLDIAGDGYYTDHLKSLATSLGVNDRVTFYGWVQADKAKELLRNARALIFPSLWHEPGGTVALESMVNGRAVVMSKVGGMPEVVIDGKNGLLVEPNDDAGMANALKRLALDYDLAKRLGEAGYQSIPEKYALADHVGNLMKIYDLPLSGAPPHAGSRLMEDIRDEKTAVKGPKELV